MDAQRVSNTLVKDLLKYVKQNPDDKIAAALLRGAIRVDGTVDSVVGKIVFATGEIDQLGAGAQTLAQGASSLSQGVGTINSGTKQLAAGLSSGVAQIPGWTPAEVTNISNIASSPVLVRQLDINDPGSYGAGFAPYFMAMSLWVGLLVLFMLLQPLPIRARLAGRLSSFGVTMVGYLPVFAVIAAQSVVLFGVVRFGLGINPVRGVALLGFLVIVGACYASILQLLNATLGVAGRLVALVLLMLQLTSSGGTYPIQTSPGFFRAISPYLPMTYAVTGIRHLIGGGTVAPVWNAIGVLLAMTVVALGVSVLYVSRHRVIKIDDIKPEISM